MRLLLREGRERSALRRHPWVFSGAVERVDGDPPAGALLPVADHKGRFLAWGHYSPHSQIRARLLSWEENAPPGGSWFRGALSRAIARRSALLADPGTDCYRLVHGEADGLPGLVVDRFGGFLVLQASTAGMEAVKGEVADLLVELTAPRGVFERSEMESRKEEGLGPSQGPLRGEDPPAELTVHEAGFLYRVDLRGGQKTGAFLDQRENRAAVAAFAAGAEVLDAFSYTGGFALHALRAGAKSVTLLDSSAGALRAAAANLGSNGLADRAELVHGDVFRDLRRMKESGRRFDLVILDPPKLAPTRAQAKHASRAYKDANLQAMSLLRPGGTLATFSCSGGVDAAYLGEIVSWAALDAGREARILRRLSQPCDHPVLLSFPESEYLKGMILRID